MPLTIPTFTNSTGQSPPNATAPEITILGDNPASVEQGNSYIDAGATAWDEVDGDLTGFQVINNTAEIDDGYGIIWHQGAVTAINARAIYLPNVGKTRLIQPAR